MVVCQLGGAFALRLSPTIFSFLGVTMNFKAHLRTIAQILTTLAIGAGLLSLTYGLYQLLGEKWFEYAFVATCSAVVYVALYQMNETVIEWNERK